jgi:hypothetical protein
VLCGEIHESRQWHVAKPSSASQRDFILAIKFERQQSSGFFGEVASSKFAARSGAGGNFTSPVSIYQNYRASSTLSCLILRHPRVPGVYLSWAIPVYLAFFAFRRINNLRPVSTAFSSISTAPTRTFRYKSS